MQRSARCLVLTLVCSLGLGVSALEAQDCRTVAAPPPLLTFGGPATVAPGEFESAFGSALSGTLFDCTHKLGSGWFGRWRRGMTDRVDLGADIQVIQHNDKGAVTAKLAARFQLRKRLRLEVGVGVADDSDGKSLNTDVGLTTGSLADKPRTHFASIRLAAARGYPGDVCCFASGRTGSDVGGTSVPPTNYQVIGTLGATARISDNARFVYECGFGRILAHFSDRTETGRVLYISVGLLFRIRKE
jgi:hypothetical protein